jgi:hypothetical protein
VRATDVTLANFQARMPTVIEGDWLWWLIAGSTGKKKSLDHAKSIASLPAVEKQRLEQWIQAVTNLARHFTAAPPPPPPLPVALPNGWGPRDPRWRAFWALMVAFYEEGLREGLPYQSNGTATNDATLRVGYEHFTREFRQAHRLDQHPDAREVCVLCGGPLVLPAVDHWIGKGAFPLLAVCANNLLPICAECNEAPQKGQKPVHDHGSFADWFHPYLRPSSGTLQLNYDTSTCTINVSSNDPTDVPKVQNLDALLNLGQRWTREFKAEYRKVQRYIQVENRERHERGLPSMDAGELLHLLAKYRNEISDFEPNYEVHSVLGDMLLDLARQQALLTI